MTDTDESQEGVKAKKVKPIIPLEQRPTVNVDEFCAMHGIGRSSFYKAVKNGDIVPCKFGKRTLITKAERERFVRNMIGYRSPTT